MLKRAFLVKFLQKSEFLKFSVIGLFLKCLLKFSGYTKLQAWKKCGHAGTEDHFVPRPISKLQAHLA